MAFNSFIIKLIKLNQCTLSPDHGPLRYFFPNGVCRYNPTCSDYVLLAIKKYGWHGGWLGFTRVLRCHPFSKAGSDPVPSNLSSNKMFFGINKKVKKI